MHLLAVLQLLALLAVANGAPVLAKKLLARRLALPLDGGVRFLDGRPLLGASKTVRGVVVAIVATTMTAPLLGLPLALGARVGVAAMLGDLLSSFVKRRLARPPSSRALGLDQVPESLLPALLGRTALALTATDIAFVVLLFLLGEILLSRWLYRLHVRDEPY